MYNILFLLSLFFISHSSFAAIAATSFTPTSVKLPIFEIGFVGGSGNIPAWRCAANSAAGCTLDIANSSALASAFTSGGVGVAADTYTGMYAQTCQSPATSYVISVKGSVTINSTTYTTQAGSEPLGTSATPDYASISLSGCQQNIYFPGGITISKGQNLTVHLLTSLSNLALGYYGTGGSSNFASSCLVGPANSALCVSYPSLVPYTGGNSPAAQVYLLTSSSADTTGATAFGQFTEFVDTSGNILGMTTATAAGSSTPLANSNNTPCPSSSCGWQISPFASPIYTIKKNSDGTLALQGYGDYGSTNAASSVISVSNFPLPDLGTVSSSFTITNPSGRVFNSPATVYATRIK